jgi:hypothetical protein
MSSVRDRLERAEGIVNPAAVVLTEAGPSPIEQDPSMIDRPTVPSAPVAPAPVVEAPVAPVVVTTPVVEAPVQKRHEWQPTDEQGRPIGGKQVILYATEQELVEKMQEKSVLLLRQLRKERREKALGAPEPPDDAEKFASVVEFKPRELSADERFRLSQNLVNPEKFGDAVEQLSEAVFGAKPAIVANTLNDAQRSSIQQRAVQNYIEFVTSTGFDDTMENREMVTGYLGKRNLAPTVANFVIAQKRLTEAGLLQEAPVVHQEPVAPAAPVAAPAAVVEEPKPQVPPTPPPALAEIETAQAKRHSHVPSGLTPVVASPAGDSPVQGTSLTLADIDKLPADVYKQRMKDPAFVKIVNQLEEDATKRRRARALGQ